MRPLKSLSWKNKPCSEGFNTHLWCFKDVGGKMFILRVNLGMWPLKSIVLEKQALFREFTTHIYGVSKEIDAKTFFFRVNLVFNCHHFVTNHLQEYVQFTIYEV